MKKLFAIVTIAFGLAIGLIATVIADPQPAIACQNADC